MTLSDHSTHSPVSSLNLEPWNLKLGKGRTATSSVHAQAPTQGAQEKNQANMWPGASLAGDTGTAAVIGDLALEP